MANQIPAILRNQKKLRQQRQKHYISQSDLMVLRDVVKDQMAFLDDVIRHAKIQASELWKECDRNNPETAVQYGYYKQCMNLKRDASNKLKRLGLIQRSIREQIKNG